MKVKMSICRPVGRFALTLPLSPGRGNSGCLSSALLQPDRSTPSPECSGKVETIPPLLPLAHRMGDVLRPSDGRRWRSRMRVVTWPGEGMSLGRVEGGSCLSLLPGNQLRISPIWGGFPGQASFFGQKQPNLGSDRIKSATDVGTSIADVGTSIADVGTSIADVGTSIADVGTSIADVGTSIADVGTSIAEVGTSIAEVGTSVAEVGTSVADVGTSVADMGTSVTDMGTSMTKGRTSVTDFVKKDGQKSPLDGRVTTNETIFGLNRQDARSAKSFTTPETRQTIAHSLSCGKPVGHTASPGRGGRTGAFLRNVVLPPRTGLLSAGIFPRLSPWAIIFRRYAAPLRPSQRTRVRCALAVNLIL